MKLLHRNEEMDMITHLFCIFIVHMLHETNSIYTLKKKFSSMTMYFNSFFFFLEAPFVRMVGLKSNEAAKIWCTVTSHVKISLKHQHHSDQMNEIDCVKLLAFPDFCSWNDWQIDCESEFQTYYVNVFAFWESVI